MRRAAAFALLAVVLPARAADCYGVDGARGSVTYEVRQAGAPFRGAFHRFGGKICLAGENVTQVDVWLDPASVDSGLPEIDAALKDKDFFAVSQYPRAAYSSDSVQARAGGQLVRGVLQLKGKSRDLDVAITLQRAAGGLAISGSATLNRLDYGIGTGEWSNTQWLGGEVKLDFNVMLVR